MSTNSVSVTNTTNNTSKKDTITFLKCRSPLVLTKTWQNGSIKDYDTAKHFRVLIKSAQGIKALGTILEEAASKPQYAVIRGTPNKDLDTGPSSASTITRTLSNFSDSPKHWVMFDIDSFLPDVSPLVDPAQGVMQWIQDVLPKPFHGLSAYWQLSASAGHTTRDPKSLRAHVWFWLDKPITGRQWKRWAEHNNLKIDKSVLSPVQLHYTANPVIELGTDPFNQRSGLLSGAAELCTNLCKFNAIPEAQQSPTLLANGDQILKDPRTAHGIIGEFNSKVSILSVISDIIPDQFSFVETEGQWDGRRLNFLHGSGGEGGAYIHSDQLHLINMQNHAPYNSQGKALNAFDLARVYKFGHLDPIDPFLQLDVSSLPSHQAMCELAQFYTLQEAPKEATEESEEVIEAKPIPTPKLPAKAHPKRHTLPFPKPYPGVMETMVNETLKTAVIPQPDLTTMGVLIGMAGACGGHYYLPTGMRLNLYGLCISPTASGKDQIRYAATMMTTAASALTLGCPASGAGLQDALPDNGGCLVDIDEAAHLFANMNAKGAAGYMIDLAKELLHLFTAGRGVYRLRSKARTAGATPARTINNPSMSFFGVTTGEKLSTAVTLDNMTDGLIGRFLFAKGDGTVIGKWGAQQLILPAAIELTGARLAWAPSGNRAITHTLDVAPLMDTWFREYRQDIVADSTNLAAAFSSRAAEKIERIAGVLAVWENPEAPVIDKSKLTWAKAFVEASNSVIVDFLQNDLGGVSEDMQDALKLLDRLKRMTDDGESDDGWIKQSALGYAMRWSKKRITPAIETLTSTNRVDQRAVKTATRVSVQIKFLKK